MTILGVIFFAALIAFAVPTFFDPRFEIVNKSSQLISVTAEWRDETMEIGLIKPGGSHEFTLEAEGGMSFQVTYPDDRQVVSKPVYFSKGFEILTTVSDDSVESKILP